MLTFVALGLTIAVLVWAARSVALSGHRLMIALPVMAFGVGSINPLIEAVVFGVMPAQEVPAMLAWHLVLALVLSFVAIVAAGRRQENNLQPRSPSLTPVRLAAAAVLYALLYLAAGMAVFPFVKEFYGTKTLPPLTTVLGLQLARGALYVFYAWMWLRLIPRNTGAVLGAVYSILGGVAPLLAENNQYMPPEVRMPHLFEVGGSNFLFGLAVGRLVRPMKSTRIG